MKKFLCIVLTLGLVMSAFGITVFATDDNIASKADNGNNSMSEEKIICNANIKIAHII